ncbi:MAG: glycosyltransferase [Gammaproteobacteria bacterium]|nr:glycosyltransferase [Gammaproteobacteria bacterium]
MKLLHITPTYYPATYWGGPIFSVYALNNVLATLPDLELKVLTTDSAGPQVSDHLNIQDLVGTYPGYEVIFSRRIADASVSVEFLRRFVPLIRQADVVHLTATYSFPTIPTLIVCRLLRKPLVWSPRGAILDAYDWDGARKRGIKKVWERVCNFIIRPGSVTLHVTSEDERHASLSRIPRAEAVIIPNGVETLPSLRECEWLPEGRLRLIFMGRLSPKKGVENLLKAIKLMEEDQSVELTIYGTGDDHYRDSLIELAEDLDILGKSVDFAGHVDGNDKRTAFLNADMCIIPSYTENFCMVVAEALGHGVPVVASHGTPWAEVEERDCGLWVDNSPEVLVQSIRVMRSRDLSAMGRNGWEWMKECYSWNIVGDAMYDVYASLLSEVNIHEA